MSWASSSDAGSVCGGSWWISKSRVRGLETDGGQEIPLAAIVANSDIVRTYRGMIGGVCQRRFERRRRYEPSCSGVVEPDVAPPGGECFTCSCTCLICGHTMTGNVVFPRTGSVPLERGCALESQPHVRCREDRGRCSARRLVVRSSF